MNRDEIIHRLTEWSDKLAELDNALGNLEIALGPADGPLNWAIEGLVGAYTDSVAESVGADPWGGAAEYGNDLEWYRFELGMGDRHAVINDIAVSDIESLADLIISTQDNGMNPLPIPPEVQ